VKRRYDAEAGFFTMNLPKLLAALHSAGLENPIVCANVNKAGFRMSGGIEGYRQAAAKYPARIIAMSVFASGGISAREAIQWVTKESYVESIVFGASGRGNIADTVALIHEFDRQRAK
jgi:phosphoribosylformimino-5-aminoimidazole carboxamide ribonucleotide (ProFAR) isomerase